jgi:hypothetical protein
MARQTSGHFHFEFFQNSKPYLTYYNRHFLGFSGYILNIARAYQNG